MNDIVTHPAEPGDGALSMLVAADSCEPTHEEISLCAYYIWLSEGSPEGQEEAHWFEAQAQLRECCHVERHLVELPSPS